MGSDSGTTCPFPSRAMGLEISERKKRPGRIDLAFRAKAPKINCRLPDLFFARFLWWWEHLLVLCTSPESQGSDQNSHDHDRFQ
jgi:hypothetical protein